MNCKTLIYDPSKQEAITLTVDKKLYKLVRWDVSDTAQILSESSLERYTELSLLTKIPQANAMVKDQLLWSIAIIQCNNIYQLPYQPVNAILEIRRWEDFSCIQEIELPECTDIPGCVTITPCQQYIIVVESYTSLYLIELSSGIVKRFAFETEYNYSLVFDPKMQFFINSSIDQFSYFQLHWIDDLATGKFSLRGGFWGDMRCHNDTIIFSPNEEAFIHTCYHFKRKLLVTYRRFNRSQLFSDRSHWGINNNPTPTSVLYKVWEVSLPYIEHQHDEENLWQSDIAFLNDQTLVLGAGKTLALLNIQDGVVKAEYQIDAIIQAIAIDTAHQRVIAATRNGVFCIHL
ncbi:hypothetical protein VF14_15885 [Nostoc linckia z18]|uniref:Uncharacterized protein n=2 Tax=Nostoc linckia TaxID=92942 RepID=A0A9Q5ZDK7_NOSLI|nr:hypothetical protein [Nostoc linckia]PHK40694.1 hypothetical protein VF12_09350 [Nostoc linckia z15]PHK48263.1 hypothetical protein VF13_00670 [Nostoc linckia z16]PHJ60930.1 hypothetical protein VF02_21045 [Nostoc linckia z1]PHJ64666.1 hypothetical protein VF05_22255 [Nostoc linckia z3]PHJ71520.1 hypothetical protein VF03_19890 [Nostoc linckia z2]